MNLIIIGAGPAGEAAAKTARRISTQSNEPTTITLIEKDEAGGLCLNKGCVPSKTLLEEVHKQSSAGAPVDWSKIQAHKKSVVTGIRGQLEQAFKSAKIDLVKGTVSFLSPSSLEVRNASNRQIYSFDKAIIATGTEPFFPPPLDQFRSLFWTSDRALDIQKTPKSVTIVGGGAVGCEFACLLNAAGSMVTIIELKDQLLPGEDPAVAAALQRSFEQRNIAIRTGNKVVAAEKTADGWSLALSQGDILKAEQVLVCVGRHMVHHGLGLDAAGVRVEKNALLLNEHLQTTNPNIYAAGDAATTRLAHAASAQGDVAAINALGGNEKFDDRYVPRCLYSWPEVASVGQWKYQLDEKHHLAKTTRGFFKNSAKALAANEADGFVQIVTDVATDKVLGAQIIGPHATELIHIFSVVLKAKMTLKELSHVMFAHPTLGEVIRDATRK